MQVANSTARVEEIRFAGSLSLMTVEEARTFRLVP
jgi:hypothetical protein